MKKLIFIFLLSLPYLLLSQGLDPERRLKAPTTKDLIMVSDSVGNRPAWKYESLDNIKMTIQGQFKNNSDAISNAAQTGDYYQASSANTMGLPPGTIIRVFEQIDTINLLIVYGQSNAQGEAENTDATAAELAERTNTKIFNPFTFSFENLDVGTNNQQYETAGRHGIELGLPDLFAEKFPGQTLHIVKVGHGGNKITQLYEGGDKFPLWYTNNIVGAIDRLLVKPNQVIKLWFYYSQGESDALTSEDRNLFAERLDTLFNQQLRPKIASDLPVIMPLLNRKNALIDTLNAEIIEFSNSSALNYYIDSDSFSVRDFDHWDYTGFKQIDTLLVDLLATVPPAIITAPVEEQYVIDSFTYDFSSYSAGELDLTNFEEIYGNAVIENYGGNNYLRLRDTVTNPYSSLTQNELRFSQIPLSSRNVTIEFTANKGTAGSKIGILLRSGYMPSNVINPVGYLIKFEYLKTTCTGYRGYASDLIFGGVNYQDGGWLQNTERKFQIILSGNSVTINYWNGSAWVLHRTETIYDTPNYNNWVRIATNGGVSFISDVDNDGKTDVYLKDIKITITE